MLVEILTVKAILMGSQTEMRNMLLDNREKAVFVIKGHNLAELCSFTSVL